MDSLTQNCKRYIDKILFPFVLSLPSYTRDSTDFLKLLEDVILEPESLLASIDVEALYTSIPHRLGIKAIDYFLSSRGCQYCAHSLFLLQLLQFTLTRNHFLFNGAFYH